MHWNFEEARQIFGLEIDQFVEFGCYPGSVPLVHDVERWESYIRDSIIEPVIGRDILQLRPVENPTLLRRLFGLAALHPAQILSYRKMIGILEARGTVPTLVQYLDLLGHAFLVSALNKYSGSRLRASRSTPKLIIHDNALIRALERRPLDAERRGRYLENAVGARLIEAGWDFTIGATGAPRWISWL